MKARQKCPLAGPTAGCLANKASCMEEKQRVTQPAVRNTQKSKQTNKRTSVSVYVCVYEERERISVTLVTTATQGCASDLCSCARACVRAGTISLISHYCVCLSAGAHRDTNEHTRTQVTLTTQVNTCQAMIGNQHLSTVSQ
jgi:hypothetical protein